MASPMIQSSRFASHTKQQISFLTTPRVTVVSPTTGVWSPVTVCFTVVGRKVVFITMPGFNSVANEPVSTSAVHRTPQHLLECTSNPLSKSLPAKYSTPVTVFRTGDSALLLKKCIPPSIAHGQDSVPGTRMVSSMRSPDQLCELLCPGRRDLI